MRHIKFFVEVLYFEPPCIADTALTYTAGQLNNSSEMLLVSGVFDSYFHEHNLPCKVINHSHECAQSATI